MRITVTEQGKNIVDIPVPLSLLLNRTGLKAIGKLLEKSLHDRKDEVAEDAQQLLSITQALPDSAAFRQLRQDLKHFKKSYPKLPLVDVDSSGCRVIIAL